MESGADVEGQNEDGETPLFAAVRSNNFHAAQLLIEAGANVNHQNKTMFSPFQMIEVRLGIEGKGERGYRGG